MGSQQFPGSAGRSILCLSLSLLILGTFATSWTSFSRSGRSLPKSAPFSDVIHNGFSGQQNSPVAGVTCEGGWCHTKTLISVHDQKASGSILKHTDIEMSWIGINYSDQQECPVGMLVSAMACRGGYCENSRLHCAKVHQDYRVESSDYHTTPWFWEAQGTTMCNDGYYVSGMACSGRMCGRVQLTCVRVDVVVRDSDPESDAFLRGRATKHTSPTFNNVKHGNSSFMAGPVGGITCSGGSCVTRQLHAYQSSVYPAVHLKGEWTAWFPSHSNSASKCPPSLVVNRMECSRVGCSNMRLHCVKLVQGFSVSSSIADTRSNWVTAGTTMCKDGQYLTGLQCRGLYKCSEMMMTCSTVVSTGNELTVFKKGPSFGFNFGHVFDDLNGCLDEEKTITSIRVWYGRFLNAMQVQYSNEWCGIRGLNRRAPNGDTFHLEADEYIVKITGVHGISVSNLQFFTSKGRVSRQFGNFPEGEEFTLEHGGRPIVGFHGNYGQSYRFEKLGSTYLEQW